MTWMIELANTLPMSMNERERAHWRTRARELFNITDAITWLALAQRIPKATGPRSVRVEIVKGPNSHHRDDPGNLPARAKSILDALVSLDYLAGDNDRWLTGLEVVESRSLQGPMVRVTIADVHSDVSDSTRDHSNKVETPQNIGHGQT